MMALQEQLATNLIAAAAIVASIGIWTAVVLRLKQGREAVAFEPRQPVPWAIVDLLLMLMAYFLFSMLGRLLLRDVWQIELPADVRELKAEHLAAVQICAMAATLATMIFTVVLVGIRTKATVTDLGLRLHRWRYDLTLGILGFVALAPPVYAMQGILVHFFPTQHPLIDALEERPDPWTLAIVALSVAVVAPLSEEFFLRVIVQGWLERVVAAAVPGAFPAETNSPDEAAPASAPVVPQATREVTESGGVGVREARAIPVVMSALFFALLHVGHGPAPIPLFFLALGLGYLYQCTHRLWPSVVVHLLLNASSLAMLALQMQP